MKSFFSIYLLFSLWTPFVVAQDEREFRDFMVGGTIKEQLAPELSLKFRVFSPMYEVDINGDYKNEKFVFEKKDGKDWMHLHDHNNVRVYSTSFEPLGERSTIYRLNLRKLSEKTNLIIIHYYEGHTNYLNFHGTSRLFYMTIDDNDYKTLSVYKGPSIFEESKTRMGVTSTYHQRGYHVSLNDFGKRGIRDVSVRYNHIVRVHRYLGLGKWLDFDTQRISD